jgi:hypothetical protein
MKRSVEVVCVTVLTDDVSVKGYPKRVSNCLFMGIYIIGRAPVLLQCLFYILSFLNVFPTSFETTRKATRLLKINEIQAN